MGLDKNDGEATGSLASWHFTFLEGVNKIRMHIKFLKYCRVHNTFLWSFINYKTQEAYSYYIQFTLNEPWLIPHKKRDFGESHVPLYGWLFFYFGRSSDGVVIPIDDKKSELWTVKSLEMREFVRRSVKRRLKFSLGVKDGKQCLIAS